MRHHAWLPMLAHWLAALLPAVAAAQSPAGAQRLAAIQKKLTQIQQAYDALPPKHRALIDGYSHAAQIARAFGKVVPRVLDAKSGIRPLSRQDLRRRIADADPAVAAVNDPSTDLDFSGFDGLTQSETSTAVCGDQVVVGFNDSGSLLQTSFGGPGGLSFSGAAVSSDRGRTFHDIGFINPGSDFNNLVIGDPVLACASPQTFYFTQLFSFGDFTAPMTGIALHVSSDGGSTWSDPVAAVAKPATATGAPGHFLDKNWAALDPSSPAHLVVSYTDFDSSGASPTCGTAARVAIEVVVSTDSGRTFGAPVVIDEQCGADTAVQGSHVAISSRGVTYVAWERFTTTAIELRLTHLTPDGAVAPSVLVEQRVLGGDTFLSGEGNGVLETDLQGELRDLVALDLAVDRSRGLTDGFVYLVWDDGRGKSVSDIAAVETVNQNAPFVTGGVYAFTDVLLSRSADGVRFSRPVQVNSDRQPVTGRRGHDHYQPAVAVDATGTVGVCWYDRRNDPQNFRIERWCARSVDAGRSWQNLRVKGTSFSPIHRLDFFVNPAYMGDYDGLASDFSGRTPGFIGAFEVMGSGMNPDVEAFRFR